MIFKRQTVCAPEMFCAAWFASLALPSALAAERGVSMGGSESAVAAAAADYFEEMPVVLTASRLRQSLGEAPSAVTVIDRNTIAASGARQLVDLLRLVPGFHVGYTNGNSPVAAYHGLSDAFARRMQVLVDGVSIYSPLYGGVEWAEVPLTLQDIERIEVVRGPNAVTYGANAFSGVINIITRDPATEPNFQLDTNLGGNGIRDASVRLAQRDDGGTWRYRISLARRDDDGFPNLPDNARIDIANLRAHYRFDAVDELALQLRSSRGAESQGFYNTTPDDPGVMRPRDTRQNTLQLRWTRAPNADDEFWIQTYHHERQAGEVAAFGLFLPHMLPIPYSVSYGHEVRRDDIEFQQAQKPSVSLRTVWGGQWREDGVRSRPFFYTDAWLHNRLTRLFGSFEWHPLDSLLVHGGAMVERNSISGRSTSPRLAVIYKPAPGHSLRFGVSRANRAPTLFEEHTNQTYDAPPVLAPLTHGLPLKITFLSSGGLRDERILSREAAYVFDIPAWKLSGDVRLFSDRISDLIVGASTHPVTALFNKTGRAFDYANSPQGVRERGYEASLHWHPWAGGELQAGAAHVRIESEMPDTQQSAPSHTRSLLLSQSLPQGMQFSVACYHVGSMRWQNAPFVLPAYTTADLRLSRQISSGPVQAEIALVTRNVLGAYVDYNLVNRERRTSWLQLKIAY